MKRYDMQYRPDWAYNQASMMPSDNGEYAKFEEANTRIAELTAEVAQYKADAERYRFLRDHADPDNEDPYITILVTNSWGTMAHTVEEGIEADRSIDAAMGERDER